MSLKYLDDIRLSRGSEQLRSYYKNLLTVDRDKALNVVNENIQFPTLYIIKDYLNTPYVKDYLSSRNQNALYICKGILEKEIAETRYFSQVSNKVIYNVLKWMVETGYREDKTDEEYDEIMDISCSLLIKLYKDNSFLPVVTQLIFERNRKNSFSYDLIWTMFESKDPKCLLLIAEKLFSNNTKDVELSEKLLNFIEVKKHLKSNEKHKYIKKWLKINHPFLYYTGETYHQSCDCKPFRLCLESKYACTPISQTPDDRMNWTIDEQRIIQFNNLSDNLRYHLASFSYSLNQSHKNLWYRWINSSLKEQLRFSIHMSGGLL